MGCSALGEGGHPRAILLQPSAPWAHTSRFSGPGVREGSILQAPLSSGLHQGRLPSLAEGRVIPRRFPGAGRSGGARGEGTGSPGPALQAASAAGELPPCARLSGGIRGGAGGFLCCSPGAPPESRSGGGGAGSELPPAAAATVAGVTRGGAQVGGRPLQPGGPASSAGGRGRESLPRHHGNGAAISKPRVCQWRGARARGYCRTAAICCGQGPNNAPLLQRRPQARGRLIGGAEDAPSSSRFLLSLGSSAGSLAALCALAARAAPPPLTNKAGLSRAPPFTPPTL